MINLEKELPAGTLSRKRACAMFPVQRKETYR